MGGHISFLFRLSFLAEIFVFHFFHFFQLRISPLVYIYFSVHLQKNQLRAIFILIAKIFHEEKLLQDAFFKNLLQGVKLQDNDKKFDNFDDDGAFI